MLAFFCLLSRLCINAYFSIFAAFIIRKELVMVGMSFLWLRSGSFEVEKRVYSLRKCKCIDDLSSWTFKCLFKRVVDPRCWYFTGVSSFKFFHSYLCCTLKSHPVSLCLSVCLTLWLYYKMLLWRFLKLRWLSKFMIDL